MLVSMPKPSTTICSRGMTREKKERCGVAADVQDLFVKDGAETADRSYARVASSKA